MNPTYWINGSGETPVFFSIPQSENPNLLVLGIKWDKSSSYRRGAAQAPPIIRKATSGELYNSYTEDQLDLREYWRLKDLGDIEPADYRSLTEQVYLKLEDTLKHDVLPVFLGGDHSITIATVGNLRRITGRDFGVIYFDAHPDLYENYNGDPYSHACVLRRLTENHTIQPENTVIIGVRAPTPEQTRYAEETGIKIITIDELHRGNPEINTGSDSVYISVDLDVLDPAYAPGVSNPEPGGISTRKLVDLIKTIKPRIIGFDIVEFNPQYDPSEITGFTAAKIIKELLGRAVVNNKLT